MSLAERLQAPPIDRSKQYCTVGKLLAELGPKDRIGEVASDYNSLVKALGDGDWSASDIARILGEEGYTVSVRHVRQHRNGDHTLRDCALPNAGVYPA